MDDNGNIGYSLGNSALLQSTKAKKQREQCKYARDINENEKQEKGEGRKD